MEGRSLQNIIPQLASFPITANSSRVLLQPHLYVVLYRHPRRPTTRGLQARVHRFSLLAPLTTPTSRICPPKAYTVTASIAPRLLPRSLRRDLSECGCVHTALAALTYGVSNSGTKYEEILFKHGKQAYEANKAHALTPAFEAVVEANTLLSGLGFESGGLAAAHAIHNGFTAIPALHHLLHGEKVAFGTVAQLLLINATSETLDKFLGFLLSVDLPVTFAQLGIPNVTMTSFLLLEYHKDPPSPRVRKSIRYRSFGRAHSTPPEWKFSDVHVMGLASLLVFEP